MGCGRLGASIANSLSEAGHTLYMLDLNTAAFDLLPPGMIEDGHILPVVGDGTLERDLRKAYAQDADIFVAVSGRDALNALAAQVAQHILQVPVVICRINDPTRNEVYSQLGLITVSATELVSSEVILHATGG
jgi:trk system potassium uptake protein TrkA